MGGVGVALAIVVGLLSSFIQSLGLTIQRKSHIQNDALPLTSQRSPARRPLWLFGFGIYITSNIFATIFQLDTLPIVILAPLGAVSLIFNAALARVVLGDRFGARTVFGTLLVAGGASLIAVFGVVQEEEHGIGELLRLWRRPQFLAFFGVVVGLTLCVLVVAHVLAFVTYRQLGRIRLSEEEEEDRGGECTPPISAAPSNYASPHDPPDIPFRHTKRRWSAPIAEGDPGVPEAYTDLPTESAPLLPPFQSALTESTPAINGTSTPHRVRFAPSAHSSPTLSPRAQAHAPPLPPPGLGSTPTPAQRRTITLLGLAFAAASGVLSGMSLVLAKAAVELLVMTLTYYRTGRGANQFTSPQSWLLLVGLAIGGLSQLVYLNYSLTFASPALICPLAFCFFNLSSIFDGLVFYDQFSLLSTVQITLVSLGVALLLFGVWVVSAVQPTGEGGVEVGTWVEEEDDDSAIELEPGDDGKLPNQPFFTLDDAPAATTLSPGDLTPDALHNGTLSPPAHDHDGQDLSASVPLLNPPADSRRPGLAQRRATLPPAPLSSEAQHAHAHGGWYASPSSTLSPPTPGSGSGSGAGTSSPARRQRRRYGSLLPLSLPLPLPGPAPLGSPLYTGRSHASRRSSGSAGCGGSGSGVGVGVAGGAASSGSSGLMGLAIAAQGHGHGHGHGHGMQLQGFAIGLGAASPGFALRAEPHDYPEGAYGHGYGHGRAEGGWRRGRSRSEGQHFLGGLAGGGMTGAGAGVLEPGQAEGGGEVEALLPGQEGDVAALSRERRRSRPRSWADWWSGLRGGAVELGAGAGEGAGAGAGEDGAVNTRVVNVD